MTDVVTVNEKTTVITSDEGDVTVVTVGTQGPSGNNGADGQDGVGNINGMTIGTVVDVANDYVAIEDVSAGNSRKILVGTFLTQVQGSIDHDSLGGFVANKHIDHSAVSISPGTGLSGGGDLTATRTLNVDINGLTADGSPDGAADYAMVHDTSAGTLKKVLLNNLPGSGGESNTASNEGVGGVGVFKQKTGINLEFRNINAGSNKVSITDDAANNEIDIDVVEGNINHDSLGGFVANEHVDHSAVSITAGTGLTGGGDLTATRTLNIAANGVTNTLLNDMAQDTLKGRVSTGAGDPEDLTATQARTLLNVEDGANNYSHPNHTGDVTSTGDGATTIADEAVTLAKMAHIATNRILGRDTAGTGDVESLTLPTVRAMLNVEDGADVTDATNVDAAGAIMDGDITANGLMIRTGAGAYTNRSIAGTTNLIDVTNGDGVSGNPTINVGANVLQTSTTKQLTVGLTTTVDAESYAASYTPDMTTQHIRTMSVTGNITINAASASGSFKLLLSADASGPYTVSFGANVKKGANCATSLEASTDYELTYNDYGTTSVVDIVKVS